VYTAKVLRQIFARRHLDGRHWPTHISAGRQTATCGDEHHEFIPDSPALHREQACAALSIDDTTFYKLAPRQADETQNRQANDDRLRQHQAAARQKRSFMHVPPPESESRQQALVKPNRQRKRLKARKRGNTLKGESHAVDHSGGELGRH
jgi:hypothetical protein